MSFKRAEKEKKRNRWIEAIWTGLLLSKIISFGMRSVRIGSGVIKLRHKSELEEEEKKKRNESDVEREHDMAK